MNTIIWVIKADVTSVLWFCKDTLEYFVMLSFPCYKWFVNKQLLLFVFGIRSLHNFRELVL